MPDLRQKIAELVIEDNTAAGAASAEASLRRVDEAVKRSVRTAEELVQKLDPVAKAEERLAVEHRKLATQSEVLAKALKDGDIAADEYDRSMVQLLENVKKAEVGLAKAKEAATANAAANRDLAKSANDAASGINNQLTAMQKLVNLTTGVKSLTPVNSPLRGLREEIEAFQRLTTEARSGLDPFGNLNARAADIAAYGRALDDLRAQFNPAFAAGRSYYEMINKIRDAHTKGAINADEMNAAMGRNFDAYARAVPAAQRVVQSLSEIADAQRRVRDTAQSFFTPENVSRLATQGPARYAAGMTESDAIRQAGYQTAAQRAGLGAEGAYQARAEDMAVWTQNINTKIAKYAPLTAATQAYAATLEEVNMLERQGFLTSQEATTARRQEAAAFAETTARIDAAARSQGRYAIGAHAATRGSNELAWQLRNIAIQTPDVVQGLLSGQSAMMIFIQQGGQVVQIAGGVTNAFRMLGTVAMQALASPAAPVVIAALALAALGTAAELSERRLDGLQNAIRGSRNDYMALGKTIDDVARSVASVSNISSSDARTAGRTVANTLAFSGNPDDLNRLIRLSKDVAVALGVDMAQAAQKAADALKDPASAAQQLADGGLKSMSQALAYSIKMQAESGDAAGASARVIDALSEAYGGAANHQTQLQKSLDELGQAFTKAGRDGRSLADVLGSAVTGAVSSVLDVITATISGLNSLRDTALGTIQGVQSQSLQSVDGSIRGPISQAAQVVGLSPEFMAAVQLVENASRQPDGSWKTSSAGARGAFQVMPSTFLDMQRKYNIQGTVDDDSANALAAGYYLREMIAQFRDTDKGLMAFNWGPKNLSDALREGAPIPDQVQNYVRLVRSQFARNPVTGVMPHEFVGPLAPTGDQLAAMRSARLVDDRAFSAYRSVSPLSIPLRENAARQSVLEAGINQAISEGDITKANEYREALAKVKGQATDLISEQEKLARSGVDNAKQFKVQDGAARDLAAIYTQFDQAARAAGTGINQVALESAQASKLFELDSVFTDNVEAIDRQTAAIARLIPAQATSAVAAEKAANLSKAEEAARKASLPGTQLRMDQIRRMSEALDRQTDATIDLKAAEDQREFAKQIEYAQKELELLTATNEVRVRELAMLKERQKLGLGMNDNLTEQQQAAVQMAGKVAMINEEYRRQSALVQGITDGLVQAFDDVGKSIVDAFVKGEQSAVRWGNVSRGIIASVLNQLFKSLVTTPLADALKPAIASLLGLGGASGAGGLLSGGTSGGGLLGGLSSLTSFLPGGSITGMFSSINSSLFGTAASTVGPLGEVLPATSGLLGSGGTLSLGGLLGGGAAGFGAGQLLNSIMGGNKQNGMIGGGLGTAAGIGLSVAFPFLAPFAPFLGGLLGGAGGGLLGPGPSVQSYGLRLQSSGFVENGPNDFAGSLKPTDRRYYNESGAALFQQADQVVAAVNAYMARRGLEVQGVSIIGGNKNGPDGSGDAGSVSEAFTRLRFRSTSAAELSNALSRQVFDDPAKLEAFVEGFYTVKEAIDKLTAESVPAFTQQLNSINTNFDSAVEQARKYTLSETALIAARARAIAALEAERAETLRRSDASLEIRRLRAGGNNLAAELAQQAEDARQELESFRDSLIELALTAEQQSARVTALQNVQALERQAILDRESKSLLEFFKSAGGNIRNYLDSLMTGTSATASPMERLSASRVIFDRDRTLALGGDRDALGRITQSADAYLTAGRDSYASGEPFQQIRNEIISSLSSLPVVQSYDAQMAASLAAIQTAVNNGTLVTSISSTGNIVQILGGGFNASGIETRLDSIHSSLYVIGSSLSDTIFGNRVAQFDIGKVTNDLIYLVASVGVDQHETLIQQVGAIISVGFWLEAVNSSIGSLAQIAVDVAAAQVTATGVTSQAVVDSSSANVNGIGVLSQLLVDGFSALVGSEGVTHQLLVDGFNALVTMQHAGILSQGAYDGGTNDYLRILHDNYVLYAGANNDYLKLIHDNHVTYTGATNNWLMALNDKTRDVNVALGIVDATSQDINDSLGTVHGSIVDVNSSLSTVDTSIRSVTSAITTLNTGLSGSINVGNRYNAATAFNTKILAGSNGIAISAEPSFSPLIDDNVDHSADKIPAFALGGVVTSPTLGLFGEAGSEAILPLGRTSGGDLGVHAYGMDFSGLMDLQDQNNRMMADLLAEVAALRNEVSTLRAESNKNASEQKKSTDSIRRPLERSIAQR